MQQSLSGEDAGQREGGLLCWPRLQGRQVGSYLAKMQVGFSRTFRNTYSSQWVNLGYEDNLVRSLLGCFKATEYF